ncbi:E3 ubiquitin-protein ligase MIB1-like [Pomacea canaliculata]|uniref:E3 ubiquitin-protein ligase MIB1-like n=1 Tax=Pomacea canaliculata TaxID=400727 RepID=UPI000D737017|nr:E3 ubiquitin-protein ligase MIB1-like [Pomacea canaliculata]
MENLALVGLRVLRGPDWAGGDEDGGEGHLGTVKEVLRNWHVRVLWDTGQESICKAGAEGKTELRIFDTAAVGVHHSGSLCSSCGEKDIFGALWSCVDCTTCDLCTTCYVLDEHDTDHCFYRLDFQNAPRVAVGQRKASVRLGAVGLLPGARVRRGKDWAWGDQDGGQDSEGTLENYEEVGPLFKRALMRVRWVNGGTNIYRVGFKGNVDVVCIEEEARFFYYRDHLPCLGTGNFAGWNDEGIISYQAACSVHPDEGDGGINSHDKDKRSRSALLETANGAEGGTDLPAKAEDISDVHPEDSSVAQNEDCGKMTLSFEKLSTNKTERLWVLKN